MFVVPQYQFKTYAPTNKEFFTFRSLSTEKIKKKKILFIPIHRYINYQNHSPYSCSCFQIMHVQSNIQLLLNISFDTKVYVRYRIRRYGTNLTHIWMMKNLPSPLQPKFGIYLVKITNFSIYLLSLSEEDHSS